MASDVLDRLQGVQRRETKSHHNSTGFLSRLNANYGSNSYEGDISIWR
jgi:hypothetical protein